MDIFFWPACCSKSKSNFNHVKVFVLLFWIQVTQFFVYLTCDVCTVCANCVPRWPRRTWHLLLISCLSILVLWVNTSTLSNINTCLYHILLSSAWVLYPDRMRSCLIGKGSTSTWSEWGRWGRVGRVCVGVGVCPGSYLARLPFPIFMINGIQYSA